MRHCRKLISILGFDKTTEKIIDFKKFTPTMIKFYDACEMVNSAWSDIASDAIVNTFRHCDFHKAIEFRNIDVNCINEELPQLLELENEFYKMIPEIHSESFLNEDDNLRVSEPLPEEIPLTNEKEDI